MRLRRFLQTQEWQFLEPPSSIEKYLTGILEMEIKEQKQAKNYQKDEKNKNRWISVKNGENRWNSKNFIIDL